MASEPVRNERAAPERRQAHEEQQAELPRTLDEKNVDRGERRERADDVRRREPRSDAIADHLVPLLLLFLRVEQRSPRRTKGEQENERDSGHQQDGRELDERVHSASLSV